MPYQIIIPKKVQKDLAKIDQNFKNKILNTLEGLAQNPYLGSKKLEGEFNNFRSIRVWPYRIIFEIIQKDLVILIIRIGHRKEIYK